MNPGTKCERCGQIYYQNLHRGHVCYDPQGQNIEQFNQSQYQGGQLNQGDETNQKPYVHVESETQKLSTAIDALRCEVRLMNAYVLELIEKL